MSKVSFQYKFLQVPALGASMAEEELNQFLATHAVVDVKQEFAVLGETAHWCYAIQWRDGPLSTGSRKKARAMVDYKEILDPVEFALFVKLRELRKECAKKEEIPAYAIFTNELLAQMAKARPATVTELAKVEGVGESRIEKYGKAFLALTADARQDG